jgi:hemin uptake protein HemP
MRIIRIPFCSEPIEIMKPAAHSPPSTPWPQAVTATPGPLHSATLLGPRGEIEIVHQGETYRLRRTRQGKLILTK